MPRREGPLSRFTVLDLTRVRAGPTAVRQLADWGADVIKVEPPEHSDSAPSLSGGRDGSDFQNLQRNKRAITLNLKTERGLELFHRLVAGADVVVENYRPEVKRRLGIDYESLRGVNPRLVYASISGFGEDGPYAGRPGFDQIAQGMGGLMSITGLPGQGPVRAGVPIADLSAGVFCAFGILVALLEREHSGEGQWVGTSLLQAQIAMLDFQAARWLMDGEVPPQAGNNHPTTIPTGVFRTADGHINIAVAGDEIWRRLCRAIDAKNLVNDPRFADGEARSANRDALNEALEVCLVRQESAHWIRALNEAGVPCGPIYRIDETFADPQVVHLDMARPVEHPRLGEITLVGQPLRLGRAPDPPYRPAPERGQHNEEVYRALGLDDEELRSLLEQGVM